MSDWFDKIVEKYPLPFQQEGRCRYAACGEGWKDLLERLIFGIHAHLHANPELPFRLNDIKEKYGTLHFYYDGGDDKIEELGEEAEFWSARTCDVCGKPGILCGQGWVQTRCPEHKPPNAPWCQKLSDWEHADENDAE